MLLARRHTYLPRPGPGPAHALLAACCTPSGPPLPLVSGCKSTAGTRTWILIFFCYASTSCFYSVPQNLMMICSERSLTVTCSSRTRRRVSTLCAAGPWTVESGARSVHGDLHEVTVHEKCNKEMWMRGWLGSLFRDTCCAAAGFRGSAQTWDWCWFTHRWAQKVARGHAAGQSNIDTRGLVNSATVHCLPIAFGVKLVGSPLHVQTSCCSTSPAAICESPSCLITRRWVLF